MIIKEAIYRLIDQYILKWTLLLLITLNTRLSARLHNKCFHQAMFAEDAIGLVTSLKIARRILIRTMIHIKEKEFLKLSCGKQS